MSGAPSGEEVSLWTYLNVMLRWRYLLVGMPVALAAVAGIWSLGSPRFYSASASFVPQESGATQTGLSQLASQFGVSIARPQTNSPQFYADLLQSRSVLREVVITSFPESGSVQVSHDLIHYFGIRSPNHEAAVALAVKALSEVLTVHTDPITGVVRFQVDTRSPELSVRIANRLLELLNDYNLQRRQSQARAEREFVEQRVALAKNELTTAEDAIARFHGANRSWESSPVLAVERDRLQRQVLLRQGLYTNLVQSLEVARIDEVRSTPVITVLDRPEGFLEPKKRYTARKVTLALFAGFFLALAAAFFLDYLARQRSDGSEGYAQFVALLKATFADLRKRPFGRRTP